MAATRAARSGAATPEPSRRTAPWSIWRASAWGKDNPTFRQVFTSRFIPGGSREQLQWFNDLCLKTTTGEIVASLLEARAVVDISASLG